MTFQPIDVLEVVAWGDTVGAVAFDPATNAYAFEYADSWVERGIELAPLYMPATPGVYVFPAIALADLVVAARQALTGTLAEGPDAEAASKQLIAVGASAGGDRAKSVIAFNPATGQIRSGQLAAPEGFEHWLIKLDGVVDDSTRETVLAEGQSYGIIEFAYRLMAVAAGLEMSECRLLQEGSRTHFLTRRFDRVGIDGRLHVLSLYGLAHLDFNMAGVHSYEQYLAVVNQLGLGAAARQQAFRRVVFNVAAVNRDDHTKNLAFLSSPSGEWSLAPAFDVTFAYNPAGLSTSRHQMTIGGRNDGIDCADPETLGDRFAVPSYRQTIDHVFEAVDRWPSFAELAGLDEQRTAVIAAEHATHRPR